MADRATGRLPGSNFWLVAGSLAIAAAFVISLCFVFGSRWETNDDVAMSMVAHGYGVAAVGSPNIIFSNVLWGYMVRAIPQINGILGYSFATLVVLITVGSVLLFGLYRFRAGCVASISVFALLLARPVLFPQFTINAGLLLVGAIICWRLFALQTDRQALLVGCLLAFAGYLVRRNEFFLLLFVAVPLLPWRILLRRRSFHVSILALALVITISAAVDNKAYQGQQWRAFNELNAVRAPFNDFGADDYLKKRPDILARYGLSANDLDLIREWFFVDPEIANPQALKAMLAELGPLASQENAMAKGWAGIQTLWDPELLPLVLTALLLALLRPSWQVAASWGFCIGAVFVIGLSGRPGILRVYVPLASLLVIAPFLVRQTADWRNRLITGVLLVAAVLNCSLVLAESKTLQASAEQTREGLAGFPGVPVVIWGIGFPLEAVYPVVGISSSAMSWQFYGLGAFTLAPFSVAFREQQQGRGMADLLVKEKGVPIVANDRCSKYLEIYCKERLHGEMKELSVQQYGTVEVSWRRCEAGP